MSRMGSNRQNDGIDSINTPSCSLCWRGLYVWPTFLLASFIMTLLCGDDGHFSFCSDLPICLYFPFVPEQSSLHPAFFTSTACTPIPVTLLTASVQESTLTRKLLWLPFQNTYVFRVALSNSVFLVYPCFILNKILNSSEGGLKSHQFC